MHDFEIFKDSVDAAPGRKARRQGFVLPVNATRPMGVDT